MQTKLVDRWLLTPKLRTCLLRKAIAIHHGALAAHAAQAMLMFPSQAEKSLVKLHDRSMPPPPPQKISSLGRPQTPRAASSMGPPAARLKHSNPFLAPPSWEEASAKPAALTAEPVPAQDISLLEQGTLPQLGGPCTRTVNQGCLQCVALWQQATLCRLCQDWS